MRRRTAIATVAALLAVGCGGGGSLPTTGTSTSAGDATKLVVLDPGNFDALVLASPRPSLVEFQSPT